MLCRRIVLLLAWALPQHASSLHTTSSYNAFEQPQRQTHRGMPVPDPPLRVVKGHVVPHTVVGKLWDGLDLTEEEHSKLDETMKEEEMREVAAGSRKLGHGELPEEQRRVQILGPQDSGTNLLEQTLLLNFGGTISASTHRDLYRVVFKHSVSNAQDLCKRYLASDIGVNLTVLVMLRSPISQLTSWHKAPYALAPCMARGYDEMGKPCFTNNSPDWNCDGPRPERIWQHTPGRSLEYRNSMEVYNRNLRQYKEMLVEPACREINVILVHYEDLVLNPRRAMKEAARKAGWPWPSNFTIVDSPAKDHGTPVGRALAVQKIASRAYTQDIALDDMAALCKQLDIDLIKDEFEWSFSKAPVPYLRDCQGH